VLSRYTASVSILLCCTWTFSQSCHLYMFESIYTFIIIRMKGRVLVHFHHENLLWIFIHEYLWRRDPDFSKRYLNQTWINHEEKAVAEMPCAYAVKISRRVIFNVKHFFLCRGPCASPAIQVKLGKWSNCWAVASACKNCLLSRDVDHHWFW